MNRFPLYARILVAIVFGVVLGLVLGPRATVLGELGKLVITFIKTLAAPLLFLAIAETLSRARFTARSAAAMVSISLVNAALALVIGLGISNWLEPGRHLRSIVSHAQGGATTQQQVKGAIDFNSIVSQFVPTSIAQPFVENAVLAIIVLAVIFGIAVRHLSAERPDDPGTRQLEQGISALLRVTEIALGWVIKLVPLAVFGVVAKTVGNQGFAAVSGLAIYVGVAILGLCLQIGIVYQAWLLLLGGLPLIGRFWKGARDAVVYALGASSSLATLPVTLKCLDRLGVSKESSRLAACVGTNLNNDGILLYEAMAVLFVAQVHGIELSLPQQLVAAVACMAAGFGIAGIPEAGLISLSLVLATTGLPTEILPLLLTVDWILSRARATTNVLSDMVVSVALDRLAPHEEQPSNRIP